MDSITNITSPANDAAVALPALDIAHPEKIFKRPSEFSFALPAGIRAASSRAFLFDNHSGSLNTFTPLAPLVVAPPAPSPCIQAIQDGMGQLIESMIILSINIKKHDPFVRAVTLVSLANKHMAQLDRVERNTCYFTFSCLAILQHCKEFSGHVKQFNTILDQLVQCQAVNGKSMIRSTELIQEVDKKLKPIIQDLILVVEKTVRKSMSAFQSEALGHFQDLKINILQACKSAIGDFVDKGYESEYEIDFEGEADPIAQMFFSQGNGCWDLEKETIRVLHGDHHLKKGGMQVPQSRKRFEKGIDCVGRGGGGGGGWCNVM